MDYVLLDVLLDARLQSSTSMFGEDCTYTTVGEVHFGRTLRMWRFDSAMHFICHAVAFLVALRNVTLHVP